MAEDRLSEIKALHWTCQGTIAVGNSCAMCWLITELEQARARGREQRDEIGRLTDSVCRGDDRLCAEYTRGHAVGMAAMRERAAQVVEKMIGAGRREIATAIRELPDV